MASFSRSAFLMRQMPNTQVTPLATSRSYRNSVNSRSLGYATSLLAGVTYWALTMTAMFGHGTMQNRQDACYPFKTAWTTLVKPRVWLQAGGKAQLTFQAKALYSGPLFRLDVIRTCKGTIDPSTKVSFRLLAIVDLLGLRRNLQWGMSASRMWKATCEKRM